MQKGELFEGSKLSPEPASSKRARKKERRNLPLAPLKWMYAYPPISWNYIYFTDGSPVLSRYCNNCMTPYATANYNPPLCKLCAGQ